MPGTSGHYQKMEMENPFDVLERRISGVESLLHRVINLMEVKSENAPNQSIAHDRKKPATREIAAEYLGVSTGTVDNLVRSKQLKVCRVGKAVRFRWEALDEFINKRNK